MKYVPTYFDFDGLEHKGEILEMFLFVGAVYILIFIASYVYSRFPRN